MTLKKLLATAQATTQVTSKKKVFHWDNYFFFLQSESILNKTIIVTSVKNFFKERVSKIRKDQHILVLVRIVTTQNVYKTIGKLRVISNNVHDQEYLIDFINSIIGIKHNNYHDLSIIRIVFSYGIRDGVAPSNIIESDNTKHITQNYSHWKLPITMDPLVYGTLIDNNETKNGNSFVLFSPSGSVFKIEQTHADGATINKVNIFSKSQQILEYTDIQKSGENTFTRLIYTNKYIYDLDTKEQLFFVKEKPTKYMVQSSADDSQFKNIITMDTETMSIIRGDGANMLFPYLINSYNGSKHNTHYLTDYSSHEEMLMASVRALCFMYNHKSVVYFHNFGGFDGVFLLTVLCKIGKVEPIMNDNRLIKVKFTAKSVDQPNKTVTLTFMDSYQVLLNSLKKLAIAFNCDSQKSIFPHHMAYPDNLNYVGPVPNYNTFIASTASADISIDEYNAYAKQFTDGNWSFRNEAIKYCQIDCVALYQVLIKFSDMIWNKFSINITKFPTITSLTFAIFKTHFIKKNSIAMITGDVRDYIKLSYTGGSTDMFIPSNIAPENLSAKEVSADNKLYCYDINSLYPYVMKEYPMPTGKLFYFEGDISKTEYVNKLGFYYCKVTAPKNLEHPIIQCALNSSYDGSPVDAMASTLGN